jgi:L,D-transpeptidase-like protein
VALTAGTSGAATAQATEATPAAPTRAEAWIARIVSPTVVRREPRGRVLMRIDGRGRWSGGPVGLLVLGTRTDPRGRLWLRVRLPIRPNGSSGWIRAEFPKLSRTRYRIEVSVGRRSVRLRHGGRVVRRYRAVVGAPFWPTPQGLFAVSERVPQANSSAFLGPWALLLTAFSPTLTNFGGGPGQVALHGRAGASLVDPLGSAASHGCIRIPNAGIRLLARAAREGTPVHVVP